jgi:hypothetical protein
MFAVNRWITCIAAALAVSACAMTSGRLSNSAERLERSSYDLSQEASDDGSGDYARDAQEFAREARDFRRVVEDRSSDDEDVHDAFATLSERYHALRDEIEDAHDRDAELDFKDVTEAYLDIEREVRRDDHDRYARD